MNALKLWTGPALVVFLWMVFAAVTLAELATVTPSLSAGPRRPAHLRHTAVSAYDRPDQSQRRTAHSSVASR
ncbi:MAG TPA: hypothetical protein VFE90_00260 [Myxococcales bacterium]|jgi:hypothetical protein|nr:hypothetical protein [Myxococcales bacterium]